MKTYRVVVTHVYLVEAESIEDAEDRVSDGMGDLAGSKYRARPESDLRDPAVDHRVYEGDDEREIRGH